MSLGQVARHSALGQGASRPNGRPVQGVEPGQGLVEGGRAGVSATSEVGISPGQPVLGRRGRFRDRAVNGHGAPPPLAADR